MKKKTTYQYTITDTQSTQTRAEPLKAKAIARCKADVKKAEVGTVGMVHAQDESELLNALVKFVKDPDGSIRMETFPLVPS